MNLVRGLGVVVAVVLLGAGVWSLRAATMSVHTRQAPDSRVEVIVEAEVRGAETGQTVEEYTRAKIAMCRTEVALADVVVDVEPVDDPAEQLFRFVLQPALDDTDRKQFRGCVHDWNLDHVEVEVVSMTDLPPGG